MMGRIYSGIATNVTQSLPQDYHTHYLHCIDYLRQAIMCAGDMSLEAHSKKDSDDNGPLDGGWSGQHGKADPLPPPVPSNHVRAVMLTTR